MPVKDVIKSTPKPTIGAVLGATVDQVAFIEMIDKIKTTHLHLVHLLSCLSLSMGVQVISGAVDLYIRRHLNVLSIHPHNDQLFIIFIIAIIGGDVTKQITSEVDLFKSIMQQNVIENEFNRKYTPLATIQLSIAIELTVKGANDLYFNLNNSHLHVLAMITKADG